MSKISVCLVFQVRDYRDPLYDWDYTFVSFEEYLDKSKELGFGIYPEIKQAYATNTVTTFPYTISTTTTTLI